MPALARVDQREDDHSEALCAMAAHSPNLHELVCRSEELACGMRAIYQILLRNCPDLQVLRVKDRLE